MNKKRNTKKEKMFRLNPKITYFFKLAGITLALIVSLGIVVVALMIFGPIDITKNIIEEGHISLNYTSIIYSVDSNGNATPFETFKAEENRVWADLSAIPYSLQKAVIAIEDQRFYKHPGFDFLSTSKAAVNFILRIPSKGGSTLTQQVVKNITGDKKHSAWRKIKEIVQALSLERKLSKDQILELYLNTIYLSRGCNGVQTAAGAYFSKQLKDLTLAESALLAGITQYPSKFDPYLNMEASIQKRNTVLAEMLRQGYIAQSEYDKATSEEVKLARTKETANINSYFGDQVFEDVLTDLVKKKGMTEDQATQLLYTGGLKIYSTVNPEIQRIMESVFADSKNFPKNTKKELQPESAMAIIDPSNGQIKGLVGGRGTKNANRILNRATNAPRQPGSSIKPIAVYGPVIDMGKAGPNTIIEDKPLNYGGWKPTNSYAGYRGNMTLWHALQQSVNTVAAQLIVDYVKADNAYQYLQKMGLTLVKEDNNPSAMALGGLHHGTNSLEMASAYGTYANGGVYVAPYTYTKVLNNKNEILLENKPVTTTVFKSSTANIMNAMLHSVVTSGIASRANFRSDLDICGKTGTTNDAKDRWFVGYTPYYTGAVWFGYDQPEPMNWVGGSNPAQAVWRTVMAEVHKNLKGKYFDRKGVPGYEGEPDQTPDPDGIEYDEDGNPIIPTADPNSTILPNTPTGPSPTDKPFVNLPTDNPKPTGISEEATPIA